MTMARQLYVVVRGLDSVIDLPVLVDGRAVDSSSITRCDLLFKREGSADVLISSESQPSMFVLQQPEFVDGRKVELIRINLRSISDPPKDGRYRVDVLLWDEEFSNGRFWGTIDVEIRPAPPAV